VFTLEPGAVTNNHISKYIDEQFSHIVNMSIPVTFPYFHFKSIVVSLLVFVWYFASSDLNAHFWSDSVVAELNREYIGESKTIPEKRQLQCLNAF
jgi:hypothetical protein